MDCGWVDGGGTAAGRRRDGRQRGRRREREHAGSTRTLNVPPIFGAHTLLAGEVCAPSTHPLSLTATINDVAVSGPARLVQTPRAARGEPGERQRMLPMVFMAVWCMELSTLERACCISVILLMAFFRVSNCS